MFEWYENSEYIFEGLHLFPKYLEKEDIGMQQRRDLRCHHSTDVGITQSARKPQQPEFVFSRNHWNLIHEDELLCQWYKKLFSDLYYEV